MSLILPSISTTEDWWSSCRLSMDALCWLQLNMDRSSLDEALHTPNTLMARGSCPQTSSFPCLPVYRYLAHSNDWSENTFLGNFCCILIRSWIVSVLLLVHSIFLFILLGLGKLYPLFILVISHSFLPQCLTQGFGVVKLNFVPVGLW